MCSDFRQKVSEGDRKHVATVNTRHKKLIQHNTFQYNSCVNGISEL